MMKSFILGSDPTSKPPTSVISLDWEPLETRDLIASTFLASEAFSSETSHPISSASERAALVFPTPGSPSSIIPFLAGVRP